MQVLRLLQFSQQNNKPAQQLRMGMEEEQVLVVRRARNQHETQEESKPVNGVVWCSGFLAALRAVVGIKQVEGGEQYSAQSSFSPAKFSCMGAGADSRGELDLTRL